MADAVILALESVGNTEAKQTPFQHLEYHNASLRDVKMGHIVRISYRQVIPISRQSKKPLRNQDISSRLTHKKPQLLAQISSL